MYTIVLDVNKKYLGVTTESGKIRHLLKEQKIKVINKEPFTIQLLSKDDIELDIFNPKKGKIENNVDASIVIKNIEFFYGHLNQEEQIRIIPLVQDILSKAKQINEDITLLDVANYLFSRFFKNSSMSLLISFANAATISFFCSSFAFAKSK